MKTFMKALFAFDTILNVENPKNVSKKSIFIIEHLIAQKLKRESNVTFPPFIVDCFHAFTQNKKQIVFEIWKLYEDDEDNQRITDLIFHRVERRESKDESKRSDDDLNNLVRKEVFDIFPNVKMLIIQSTVWDYSYSFSLIAFLDAISKCKLGKIIIK